MPGVAGTWKDLTDNVNSMASNLTGQVRNIAEVTTAVANGDLSQKITVDVKGEILELKNTINTMVDQLNAFASEVTRVAREVGTEGKLGGQARSPGVAGTWKDLTDNVNSMAVNLTGQVRNIAEVTIAVANGDLSKKITVDVRGEILQLKDTINTMVDQLQRVRGRGHAASRARSAPKASSAARPQVPGVAGTWKDLTDNVNSMAVEPHRPGAQHRRRHDRDRARRPVAQDHGRREGRDPRAEEHHQHDGRSAQRVRVGSHARRARGRHRRQARRPGASCPASPARGRTSPTTSTRWRRNLTGQVRNIAEVTIAVANGDLSQKITVDVRGEILQLKETINTMVEQLRSFASEVTRVAREVGTEGRLGVQAVVPGVAGTWKDLTDSVNAMGANLTAQVRNIAEVTTAVARGDLSRKITVDVKGEILELKNTINTMVDQLNVVRRRGDARRARGRHRGQARRPGRRCPASPARGRTSPTTSTSWPRTSPTRCAASSRS